MQRVTRLIALVAMGMGLCLAGAQAAEKFGYVDLQQALNTVSEGKQAKQELERTYATRQKELDGLQRTLEKMKDDLERDRLVLSAEALQQKEEVYRNKFLELTQKMNSYKMELAQKEAESTGAILNAVRQVVEKIGQDEGYAMILETSQDVVLFSPSKADLTPQVIKAYNALPKSQRRMPAR